jgi:hypothetical protein
MMEEREFKSVDDIFIFDTLRDMRDLFRDELADGEKVAVTTLVDGHHGIHIPEILFDMAGIKNVQEDWAQDMVCDILSDWTEGLQKHFDDQGWTIEYNETDGSIDVFYQDMDAVERRENIEWAVGSYELEMTAKHFADLIKVAIVGTPGEDYTDGEVLDIISEICEKVDDVDGIKDIFRKYEVTP